MPSTRPEMTITGRLLNPPTSATASAGTTSRVNPDGVTATSGEITAPASPAMSAPSPQFASATRSGETPTMTLPFSDSTTARVTSTEPGEVVDRHRDHQQRHRQPSRPQPVGGHLQSPEHERVTGEDLRDADRVGAEPQGDHALEHEQHPDRGHGLRQRPGVPQRPEDDHVAQQAEHGADRRGDQQRQPDRHRPAQVDQGGQPEDRVEQRPGRPQSVVGVGGVHADRAGREVDDAGTPVKDRQAQPEGRQDGARSQPEDQERQVLRHSPLPRFRCAISMPPPGFQMPFSSCDALYEPTREKVPPRSSPGTPRRCTPTTRPRSRSRRS